MRPLVPCAQVKEEGWWLVAGDASSGDLFAIKRVSFGQRTTARSVLRGVRGVAACAAVSSTTD